MHLGMMSHNTFWDVGCPRIHWFPNSWQKIILYTLFFCSWSIYVLFFFLFKFNFWNYMVDWYMLLGTMLTISNQLILWKLPSPQRLANFRQYFLSNVSSTFLHPCVWRSLSHAHPPWKSWMTCTYLLCLSNGINGNSLSLDDSKKILYSLTPLTH